LATNLSERGRHIASEPSRIWSQTFDTSDSTSYYSAPAVVNGYVYTSVGESGNPGVVYLFKLDLSNGDIVWRTFEGNATGPPVI